MKKILLSLGVAGMLGIASCSEDFEVTAPYKDITVIYGLWDKNDTAHYVRIQKAFLDENKSAVDMSKTPDSSYFRDITVVVKEFSGSTQVGTPTPLTRVDLKAEGYEKDTAINMFSFFREPHYGYKLKKTLNPNNTYRLVVTNNETGNVDSSTISVVGDITSAFFVSANQTVEFPKVGSRLSFNLSPATPNAKYHEGILRFNYRERNTGGTDVVKHADMYMGRINAANGRIEVLNQLIYNFLAQEIGPGNGKERRMDSCDVYLFAGGVELYQYQLLANNSGGVNGDQIRPNFTNILGKNAMGLLASRATQAYTGHYIGPNTLDSLIKNPLTLNLNIVR